MRVNVMRGIRSRCRHVMRGKTSRSRHVMRGLVIYTRDWFRELLQIFLNNNVSEICNVLFDVAHKRHGSSYFPVFWMNLKN